jgi:hypothetical protein
MPTIDDIISAFESEFAFDPRGIYCSVTGKRIGTADSEEFASVVRLISVSNEDADAISLDLGMRLLASLRPSLKWNKFRAESLRDMRVSDPVETLAYLINRMFAPLNRQKVGVESLLGYHSDRIKGYQLIERWGTTDETHTLTYMLLEIDAKMGLDVESAPFNAYDFFFDAPDMATRIAMVQGWYANLMTKWEKRLKDDELQTRWMRNGSVLAKPAFADAFMESKPLSVTAIKKEEKKAEKAFFADVAFENPILRELFGVESAEQKAEARPAPIIVPRQKTPLKFGVKS